MDGLKSVGNLALLTIQPLEGRLVAVLSALVLLGLPTAVATQSSALSALLTFLALLAVLLAIAGYKLQRAHDKRMRPDITIELSVENLPGVLRRDPGEFHERLAFWVRVKNLGPDAEFVARVENVSNARRAETLRPLDASYSVDRVAWVDTTSGRIALSRQEVGVLRLAEWAIPKAPGVPQDPVVYFFQAATEAFNPRGHGAGWLLNASLDSGPITFDLTVSNITADAQVTRGLSIGYDSYMRIVLGVAEP